MPVDLEYVYSHNMETHLSHTRVSSMFADDIV